MSSTQPPLVLPVLTEDDFAIAQAQGWTDAGWFFSRARGRVLADRLRQLPPGEQDSRLTLARKELIRMSLHTTTLMAWNTVVQEGMGAVCEVLCNPTDGGQAQVLRTSFPAAFWEGLMDEQDRQDLMAQVRLELRQHT